MDAGRAVVALPSVPGILLLGMPASATGEGHKSVSPELMGSSPRRFASFNDALGALDGAD